MSTAEGAAQRPLAGVRIGLVGLDTSHPAAFLPLLHDLGARVTAVEDAPGGALARDFADRHGVPHVASADADLAEHCDVVLLLGRDWDARLGRVDALLEAGLGVCVDKPVAGRAVDLEHIAERAAGGAPVSGGSSLRFAREALAWRAKAQPATRLTVRTAGHPLYYGVHAVTLAAALLGEGLDSARADLATEGFAGSLRHAGGAEVRVEVRPPGTSPTFSARIETVQGVEELVPEGSGLYAPYLATVVPFLAGRAPAPVSPTALVEPELALLALAWSAKHGGTRVQLDRTPRMWAPWAGADLG